MARRRKSFANPFRPGAGHKPPYLAGREEEKSEFQKLLKQDVILTNLVLTGLRGVGKTVLLDEFRPMAIQQDWLWVGTDLSETASLTEERLAVRLLADLAAKTSSLVVHEEEIAGVRFRPEIETHQHTLNFDFLNRYFQSVPGLVSDKLRATLELVWTLIQGRGYRGVLFAYDEAQNLADHADDREYPLSLLLDVFQSVQRKEVPFLLVLVGLPTLFPKLVEARTFSERMFHVVTLDRLSRQDSRAAIEQPIRETGCPVQLGTRLIDDIISESAGYPYFLQFICREVYDVALQNHKDEDELYLSVREITRKLDSDFFAGRWARVTDRQRDLLQVISQLENCDTEFSIQDVVEQSKRSANPFGASHVNQMLIKLAAAGIVYKNRHGRYCFAVPLFGQFIRRQTV